MSSEYLRWYYDSKSLRVYLSDDGSFRSRTDAFEALLCQIDMDIEYLTVDIRWYETYIKEESLTVESIVERNTEFKKTNDGKTIMWIVWDRDHYAFESVVEYRESKNWGRLFHEAFVFPNEYDAKKYSITYIESELRRKKYLLARLNADLNFVKDELRGCREDEVRTES